MQKEGCSCPELVTINPSFIFGTSICNGAQTSTEFVRKWIMNEMYGYPNMRMNIVDVRDCSIAHLRAMEIPEAANKRFILS